MSRMCQLLACLLTLSVAAPVVAQTFPTNDPVLKKIWDEGMTDRSQVASLAQILLDSIGPRLTGSPGHLAAIDWMASNYQKWGIPVRKEQYGTWRGWTRGQTVLVTGAGGSIGAELCRQLTQFAPRRIVLLGRGENSIFDIHQELEAGTGRVQYIPVVADVRDRDRLARVFETYDPVAVFHAAAHKHVPMMECNVAEAITNNVLGTQNVVDVAAQGRVECLVHVSTDKAVRPTSVMGATKRVAEQIVQLATTQLGRNFVAVRFGNVLGSRGSVVPIFMRQIAAGGPVTVTHPEMRRYFMTIPEAVELILQAGALGRGGEVFVLDMGEPVKITDLAADLIRLSGKEAGRDIEIQYSGIRPGEKLYEEMFFGAEHATPTEHARILMARNSQLADGAPEAIAQLVWSAQHGGSDEELRGLLAQLVPDFTPKLIAPSETRRILWSA